ncbi:hypothetical protein FZC76_17550 [Sutcliffiella horikoshii]|uniref:Uncharacterized protein n=1 Tax=Sutcliffiella horikoshii TaxID=79883 RepID=A0A5D4SUC3_9BACI|nr:hypothetical protein [Sutcliffiella horikoshii]TYS65694.1 hypothetical protein FZC76_17550 [Sutcliffiella horikoshii]
MSDEQKKVETEMDVDPFTRMMFGGPPRSQNTEDNTVTTSDKKVGEDYYALIEQVDSIMESVNKLKPMIKEFSPILKYFKK